MIPSWVSDKLRLEQDNLEKKMVCQSFLPRIDEGQKWARSFFLCVRWHFANVAYVAQLTESIWFRRWLSDSAEKCRIPVSDVQIDPVSSKICSHWITITVDSCFDPRASPIVSSRLALGAMWRKRDQKHIGAFTFSILLHPVLRIKPIACDMYS